MKRKRLSGPTVCGFYDLFENDYGDSTTPSPYQRITPSRVGNALIPFHCPRCDKGIDFSTKEKRDHYKGDDFYFCPWCGLRFYLNTQGKIANEIAPNGTASAIVEEVSRDENGLVEVKRSETKFLEITPENTYVLGIA